ncbi:hypothetical protein HGRIS_014024 [Hohenbuehelia grisea]|uniref:DUF6534 domain-containing protein n=1 Tax=Hohenbuehelia grisea TaxID=104357 RepID=A0ABR3JSD6_9AGAR
MDSPSSASPYWLPSAFIPFLLGGIILALPLYGVALAQFIWYSRVYKKDRTFFKVSVWVSIILETLHVVCLAHGVFRFFMIGRLKDLYSIVMPSSMMVSEISSYFVTTVVQSSYNWRLWQLSGSRNKYYTIVIAGISFVQLVLGLLLCAHGLRVTNVIPKSVFAPGSNRFRLGQLSASMTCDLLITVGMAYYLRFGHVDTNFRRTRGLIVRLTLYTVSIGFVTSLLAAVALITLLRSPSTHRYDYVIPYFLISPMYINSYLASLNARAALRKIDEASNIQVMDVNTDGDIVFKNISFAPATVSLSENSEDSHTAASAINPLASSSYRRPDGSTV